MTIITRLQDRIDVIGHANYGPRGQDIVCAGISALTQALVESVKTESEEIQVICDESAAHVTVFIPSNPPERIKAFEDCFFIGVRMIAEEFPEHVRVSEH